MASVAQQILKQVEFYFSDSNFRRDKFLKEETTKHTDGYIPFKVLFTFKKLAELTTDATVLAAALESSDVVELNEVKDGVRRKHALPEKDDSASRTAVFAALGSTMPTIEEIKKAFSVIDVEPLYTHRKMLRKKFAGVARIEFKDVATLEHVKANVDKISILQHTPVMLPLKEFEALSADEQTEFEKAVCAMLVSKGVPQKPIGEFYDAFLPIWQEETVLRGRIKHVAESNDLYVMFTQQKFAESVLELINTKFPIVLDNQTLSFELVTDKEAIAARPRSHRNRDEKKDKRKREPEGKAIHISNIPSRVRLEDVKKLVMRGMETTERSPYITYEGLDTAKFVIHDNEEATAIFSKLNALEDAELGGQKVVFHLLEPNEELHVEVSYEKGLIVRFDDVDGEVSRDVIKDTINEKLQAVVDDAVKGEENVKDEENTPGYSGVAFIQYQMNDKSGFLRVTFAPVAKQVVALINNGLEINNVKFKSATLLEGEEEKAFWVEARNARSNRFKQLQKNKQQNNFRGGRGRGRGGGSNKRQRN